MAKRFRLSPKQKAVLTTLTPACKVAALPALAIGMFFAVCLASANTVKGTAVFFAALAFVCGAAGFKRLRGRFTLPMMALGLFVLVGGISTFYAVAGKFALQEFLKILIAFCFACVLLAVAPGDGAAPGRRIASVLSGFTAFSGLVSIDLISTRILSNGVIGMLNVSSEDYANFHALEIGTRINSIFQNPNVFASIAGLGVLLALGLVISSENSRERAGHLICLYVNALSFMLAFSMGAIGFIAAAFLVYLLLELPERRARLFVLMVETLLLTLPSVALISATSFDAWEGIRPIPLLCAVVGAAALWAADRFVGQPVGEKLTGHGKLLAGLISGVLAAAAVFVVLAYNLTGGMELAAGEKVERSIYPAPGEYTVNAETDGNVNVVIRYQNKQDTMMQNEDRILYKGKLADAKFTVPEDSLVVYFRFSSKEDAYIESVECIGTENVAVPLGYKLLPSFIANRLQGLFANQNAIQRTVFFEDGLKIFAMSPVIGRGLGSYENGILNVQSFFYETKYAHNHYIQTMAETGIIGLVTFLLVLGVSAAAILFDRRRKHDCHVLTPALGAALVFMAGHALMEVNFSYYAYLPIAFGVFALIALCCGEAIPVPGAMTVRVKSTVVITFAVLTALFSYFLLNNISAQAVLKRENITMDDLAEAAEIDKFEYADYLHSYVASAMNFPDNMEIQEKAFEYAERLAEIDSNTIPYTLAVFYFFHDQNAEATAMLEKYVRYVASNEAAWGKALELARANVDSSAEYREGMERIVFFYDEWTETNMGTIELSEENSFFLNSFRYDMAEACFMEGRTAEAMVMVEKYLRTMASNQLTWMAALEQVRVYYEASPEYRAGMERIVSFYKEWTAENGDVALSKEYRDFLSQFGLERTDGQ